MAEKVGDIEQEMESKDELPSKLVGSVKRASPPGSLRMVLKHSDGLDMLLMTLGTVGCIADGVCMSAIMLVLSNLMNGYAAAATLTPHDINKYALALLYVAVAVGSGAFLDSKLPHEPSNVHHSSTGCSVPLLETGYCRNPCTVNFDYSRGWYGSILVTEKGIKGGNAFTAGVCIVYGGLSLGSSLINVEHFMEANVAAALIFEMIERVSSIDSANQQGKIMSEVRGQVVESGPHDQLIQNNHSPYAAMVQLQQAFMNDEIVSTSAANESNNSFSNREETSKLTQTSHRAKPVHEAEEQYSPLSLRHIMQMNESQWKAALLGCTDSLAVVTQAISGATLAIILGLVLAWKLALAAIAMQPLIIGAFFVKAIMMRTMSKKILKAQSKSSELASEAVGNQRIISAFCSQEKVMALFETTQIGPKNESHKQSWFAGIGLFISQFLTAANSGLLFWYGGKLLYHGEIKYKHLFQTFFILVTTGRVIAETGSMNMDLLKGINAIKSIFKIMKRTSPMNPDKPDGINPAKIYGDVEFKEVDFFYPTRPRQMILTGLSLKINAEGSHGELLAKGEMGVYYSLVRLQQQANMGR
ncbi:hypothetical protein Acr_19g0008000 [Actinidia rufa]|uniref:ABC transmembrane type-1 domain-containing protein n=1 Tax=Actinidia rufa TaxID=165716 RepID=A0A7J0GAQ8_9ERIC|nr:hypothetical protein Acr_19g0008000 [Actinidia rufa]